MSSSSSSPPDKKITLKSSDGETFQVDEPIALESQLIKHMIEDGCADAAIPLPNLTGRILGKVIEYLKKHNEAAAEGKDKYAAGEAADELKTWDSNFVREVQVDQPVLFDLIMAANYLDMKKLLDLLCEAVANMMRGKQPEEIRKLFHIKNDYTPEEEDEVRRENQWLLSRS